MLGSLVVVLYRHVISERTVLFITCAPVECSSTAEQQLERLPAELLGKREVQKGKSRSIQKACTELESFQSNRAEPAHSIEIYITNNKILRINNSYFRSQNGMYRMSEMNLLY